MKGILKDLISQSNLKDAAIKRLSDTFDGIAAYLGVGVTDLHSLRSAALLCVPLPVCHEKLRMSLSTLKEAYEHRKVMPESINTVCATLKDLLPCEEAKLIESLNDVFRDEHVFTSAREIANVLELIKSDFQLSIVKVCEGVNIVFHNSNSNEGKYSIASQISKIQKKASKKGIITVSNKILVGNISLFSILNKIITLHICSPDADSSIIYDLSEDNAITCAVNNLIHLNKSINIEEIFDQLHRNPKFTICKPELKNYLVELGYLNNAFAMRIRQEKIEDILKRNLNLSDADRCVIDYANTVESFNTQQLIRDTAMPYNTAKMYLIYSPYLKRVDRGNYSII